MKNNENMELSTVIIAGDEYSVPAAKMDIMTPFIERGLASNKWKEKFSLDEQIVIYTTIAKQQEARDIIGYAMENDIELDWNYLNENHLNMGLADWDLAAYLYSHGVWNDEDYLKYQCYSGELHDAEFFNKYFATVKEKQSWMDVIVSVCAKEENGEVIARVFANEYLLGLMDAEENKEDVCELIIAGIITTGFQTLYDYITNVAKSIETRSRLVSLFLNIEGCEDSITSEGVDIYKVIDIFFELGVDLRYIKMPIRFILEIVKNKKTYIGDPRFINQLLTVIAGNDDIFRLLPVIKDFVDLTGFEEYLTPNHTYFLTFFKLQGVNVENRFILMDMPSSHEELYVAYDKQSNAIYTQKGEILSIDQYLEKVGQDMLSSQLDELTEFTVDAYIINKFIREMTAYARDNGFIEEVEADSEPIEAEVVEMDSVLNEDDCNPEIIDVDEDSVSEAKSITESIVQSETQSDTEPDNGPVDNGDVGPGVTEPGVETQPTTNPETQPTTGPDNGPVDSGDTEPEPYVEPLGADDVIESSDIPVTNVDDSEEYATTEDWEKWSTDDNTVNQ